VHPGIAYRALAFDQKFLADIRKLTLAHLPQIVGRERSERNREAGVVHAQTLAEADSTLSIVVCDSGPLAISTAGS